MQMIESVAPKVKRPALTKRLILDTSAVLFLEKGYDRTSLDDIAGALSVTKPSLYYHFSNKEDILLECVNVANEYFRKEMSIRDDPAKNGRERVEIMLRLYLEVITHDVGVSMVIADDRVMSSAGREHYSQLRRILNQELVDRIAQGAMDGSLIVDDVRLTTFAIFGMFNWVGHWYFRRKVAEFDEIFSNFMGLIFRGLAPVRISET